MMQRMLFFLLVLCLPRLGSAQSIEMRPVCEAVGTRSEGWYQSGIRIDFAQCAGCLSACLHSGTDQEGWYNWCDQSLISAERCAHTLPVFSDIPERHPLYPAIHFVASVGLVEGYPVTRAGKDVREYRPLARINRAEFTKIIMGALFDREQIEACKDVRFSDVEAGAWFAPFVCIASEMGVVHGHPDGTFRPGSDINFAEAAAVLARAFRLSSSSASSASSAPWYRAPTEMLAAVRAIPASITSFNHRLTRGEMADIYHRLQVPDPQRPTLTYEALVALSVPPASSSSSSPSLSSALPLSSAAAPPVRLSHAGGVFSLVLPPDWQRVENSARFPIVQIGTGVIMAGASPTGGFGMMADVFTAEALQKPANEPFFPLLRRMILPSLDERAFQSTAYEDWTRYEVRPTPVAGAVQAYYVFFVRGDTAVLLNFAGEDATSAAIVASFQWGVSSSAP